MTINSITVKLQTFCWLLFLACIQLSTHSFGQTPTPNTPLVLEADAADYTRLSPTNESIVPPKSALRFEENVGQLSEPVFFKANDAQATHFFLDGEIRTSIQGAKKDDRYNYAMELLGISDEAAYRAIGGRKGPRGRRSYHTENGSFDDVPLHHRLEYNKLWDGISAVFYERDGQMKYDFHVLANADPSNIQLRLKGMKDLSVNEKGELEFTTSLGRLSKGVPYTYQVIDGKQVKVEAAYKVEGDVLSFDLGAYDASLPLIIDPIALKWASFLEGGDWTAADAYFDPVSDKLYLVGYASPSNSNFIGAHVEGVISDFDVVIQCLEKDGSAVLWTTIIGGSSRDFGIGIYVDGSGDIFITGYTRSSNFPMNSTITGYDMTHNGDSDAFVMRLDANATTIKYASFFGSSQNDNRHSLKGIVVEGDLVYSAITARLDMFGQLPTPTYSSPVVPTRSFRYTMGLFSLNTSTAGAAGLEGYALIGAFASAGAIRKDGAGNIYIAGDNNTVDDAMLTPNATQTAASIAAVAPDLIAENDGLPLVAKFNSSLDELLYASYVLPVFNARDLDLAGTMVMDVNEAGDIFVSTDHFYSTSSVDEILYAPSTGPTRDYSNTGIVGDNFGYHRTLAKIPADNPSSYSFINVMPGDDYYSAHYQIDLDSKGRIHFINSQYTNGAVGTALPTKVSTTAGAVVPFSQVSSASIVSTYSVFNASGGLEYGTILPSNGGPWDWMSNLYVDPTSCTAYVVTSVDRSSALPLVTPSYRDEETGLQVNVTNTAPLAGSSAYIAVFHEPDPENVITDFQAGNNEFCVNSLIYQGANDGPILGDDPIYTSGDGTAATHNIPDLNSLATGTTQSHPIPVSPNGSFLWQVSRDNGTSWSDIPGSILSVLKPQPETIAGTVQYRRGFMTGCCDTTYSNVATATILGTFDMLINAPTEPVYFCPGSLTDLGINIKGATGNISWQWYDGFDPISDDIITPASGSGVDQSAFTASIATSQTVDGFYRLVVTDAGGCKKEGFVFMSVLTAVATIEGNTVPICPGGTNTRTIGPAATNPAFDYQWSGPGGFTSTETNPEVTTAGTYTLEVAVAGSGAFCAAGATTVDVTAAVPHDAALTTIPNSIFCQSDDPAPIGLAGTAPANYVFQWSPGVNLDNVQAFSPKFDPGVLPFDQSPTSTVEYNFTALRDDGCIFETTTSVTDNALAVADAGGYRPACSTTTIGDNTTTGSYFEWAAVSTTHPSGLATLVADPEFMIDDANANLGSSYYAKVAAPLLNGGTECYQVTYELRSSFTPFPSTCFATDQVTVEYCCGDAWCPIPTAALAGTDGSCSGITNIVDVGIPTGLTVEWTTYSIDGVIQAADTPPQGVFTVVNDSLGTAISAAGPHPSAVVVNIDDATWGWAGANVVEYQVRVSGTLEGQTIDCSQQFQVYSALNSTPVIGVLDKSLCNFPAGTPINLGPGQPPYTVSGLDYTQAPNSSLGWEWEIVGGGTSSITSGGATPFPTLAPLATTSYQMIVTDPVTGCVARDTFDLALVNIVANAGSDITGVCSGSLVQLGSPAAANHTYSWSPTSGLNFPIGTANSTAAEPYLLLPDAPSGVTFTITSTETTTGCQATDQITITTNNDPPVTPPTATWNICTSAEAPSFTAAISGSALIGHTYQWSVLAGGGDIGWFDDATAFKPTITVPQGTASGTYTFRLTVTKGDCGSTTQDYTIVIHDIPAVDLGADLTPVCPTPYTALTTASDADYTYSWDPADNLFLDDVGSTFYPPTASDPTYHTVYVAPSAEDNTYTLTATHNSYISCYATDVIIVGAALPDPVEAGNSGSYCPGDDPIAIGEANSGVLHLWEAVGYNANPENAPATPSGAEATTMMTYIGASTSNETTFSQSGGTAGIYVYRLTSTFANGCTSSDEVTITVPILDSGFAGASQSVCEGASVQIGTAVNIDYSYSWTALEPVTEISSIDDASLPQPTVKPSVTTVYQVTVTQVQTGCKVTEIVGVSVAPKPSFADVILATQCAPINAVNLTAEIPDYATYFNHKWTINSVPNTEETTPTAVTPIATTSYFLVAENAIGCQDTAQVTINVQEPKTPNILPTVYLNCSGDGTVDLTAASIQGSPSDPTFTLEWHSDDTTDPLTLITPTAVGAGTYYLFETSAICSSSSVAVTVVNPGCFFSLGNRVFADVNNDGEQNVGESGIDGVTLQLLNADGTAYDYDQTTAGTQNLTVVTANNGYYRFDGVPAGDYIVEVLASNFASSLTGLASSNGAAQEEDPNTDLDSDDNGLDALVVGAVRSSVITLGTTEPLGETEPASYDAGSFGPSGSTIGTDDLSNLTIDFGFYTPTIDLELTKVVDESIKKIGDDILFTIQLDNEGDITAHTIIVNDDLPNSLIFKSYDATTGTYVSATGEWSLDSLEVGHSQKLYIIAEIVKDTVVSNVAEVIAVVETDVDSAPNNDNGDQSEDDEDRAVVFVTPEIDLSVTKAVSQKNGTVGDAISYTITVKNDGPSIAHNVKLLDQLPAGLTQTGVATGTSDQTEAAWPYASDTLKMDSVSVGETITLTINATINSINSTITNSTEIVAADEDDVDSTPGNAATSEEDDEASVDITPTTFDIELLKNILKNGYVLGNRKVKLGDTVTYVLRVTNPSSGGLTGVLVADRLPTGVDYISQNGDGTYDETTGVWTTGYVSPKRQLRINILVKASAAGMISNTAEVSAMDQQDIDSIPGNGVESEDDQQTAIMEVVKPKKKFEIKVSGL